MTLDASLGLATWFRGQYMIPGRSLICDRVRTYGSLILTGVRATGSCCGSAKMPPVEDDNVEPEPPDKGQWIPYESAKIPFLSGDSARRALKTRWTVFRPLHRPLLSGRTTVGEVLVVGLCVTLSTLLSTLDVVNHDLNASGTLAVLVLGFVYFLSARDSLLALLAGIPFERALIYHKLSALVSIVIGFAHGLIFYFWGRRPDRRFPDETRAPGGIGLSDTDAVTGWLLEFVMLFLLITAQAPIRRYLFELFYRLHVVFMVACVALAFVHPGTDVIFGLLLYVFDAGIRVMQRTTCRKDCYVERLPGQVIRLRFSKGNLKYRAGQYLFVMIPELSIWEWHPFSISSAPSEQHVSIHVRVLGDWTKTLANKAESWTNPIRTYVEGPYGDCSVDIDSDAYSCFLVVSGGIGITPMQSITNELLAQRQRGRRIDKIWFVWSVRDRDMMDAFYPNDPSSVASMREDPALPAVFSPDNLSEHCDSNNPIGGDPLYSEFFMTRVRDPSQYSPSHPCLRFGRPDWQQIFTRMRQLAADAGVKRVAVLVCGPGGLVGDVAANSASHSDAAVTFDFHAETFLF